MVLGRNQMVEKGYWWKRGTRWLPDGCELEDWGADLRQLERQKRLQLSIQRSDQRVCNASQGKPRIKQMLEMGNKRNKFFLQWLPETIKVMG